MRATCWRPACGRCHGIASQPAAAFRQLRCAAPVLCRQGAPKQRGGGVDGGNGGNRCARDLAQLDDRTYQRLQLQHAAVLHILQHRGLVRTHGLGAGDALVQRDLELHAQLFRHRLRLAHHGRRELARSRKTADVLQRGVRERADGIEAEVAPQLEPDLAADVLADRCLEAGAHQSVRQCLDAFTAFTTGLAQREAVALDHPHDPRGHQLCRGIYHAADHTLGLDMGGDHAARIDAVEATAFVRPGQLVKVPPRDAVDHAHHHGPGAEQPAQIGQQIAQLVRLHGQKHSVLGSGIGAGLHGSHTCGVLRAAVLALQHEAAGIDGFEVAIARDEGHVFTGQGQPGPQITTDRTSPDDCDFHAAAS